MLARIKTRIVDHIKYLYWKHEENILPVAAIVLLMVFFYFAYGVDGNASMSM